MGYESSIINQLISNFDFAYTLSINILTYFIIKLIDIANGDKKVSTLTKRIVLVCCTIVCCIIYKIYTPIENYILINSTILAPVAYSWVFKPILKKLNINYNTDEKEK